MKLLISLLLLFVACDISAIEINPKLSGSWYNPDQDGHGLNVATLTEDLTVVYWYVYHTDGTPMFLVTVGTNDGNSTSGTTYYNTGMKFGEFNKDDRKQTVWGSSKVTFHDCNSATLEYSADDPEYGSGTIPMVRLAWVSGLKCTDSLATGNYHMSLLYKGDWAFGFAHLFENGFVGFRAFGDSGAITGFGEYRWTSDDRFDLDFTAFDLGGDGWEEIEGSAEYIGGAFVATFPDGMEAIATKIENFQRSISANLIAGTFDIRDNFDVVVGTLTIKANGSATGRIFNGCDLDGVVWIPNDLFNQLAMELNTSNCDWFSPVTGTGNVGGDNNLYFEATDRWLGLVWNLKK